MQAYVAISGAFKETMKHSVLTTICFDFLPTLKQNFTLSPLYQRRVMNILISRWIPYFLNIFKKYVSGEQVDSVMKEKKTDANCFFL